MASNQTFPIPKTITGGCLCGSVRYQVDFPANHDFKKASGSCQCTQCRKQTGSLFFTCHTVSPASTCFRFLASSISGSSSSTSKPPIPPTLRIYNASPAGDRAFCSQCGGFLYWKSRDAESDSLTIAVGSVDAKDLFGEGAEKGGEGEKGYGLALANGWGGHGWCANEIAGVTDNIPVLGADGRGTRSLED